MDAQSLFQGYFPSLDNTTVDRLVALKEVYAFWNAQINVVSRKDFDNFYVHHVLHSLAILKYRDLSQYKMVVDIGTGGGFPAVPLALVCNQTTFVAIDSIGKKIKVVNEVCQALDIKNLDAKNGRIEEIRPRSEIFITRAVASSAQLWQWAKPSMIIKRQDVLRSGIIALKGGDLEQELMEVNAAFTERRLADWFKDPFFETKKLVHLYPLM